MALKPHLLKHRDAIICTDGAVRRDFAKLANMMFCLRWVDSDNCALRAGRYESPLPCPGVELAVAPDRRAGRGAGRGAGGGSGGGRARGGGGGPSS